MVVAGYAAFIGIVFVLMPPNPDEITAPMDLVNGFRAMLVVTVNPILDITCHYPRCILAQIQT